MRTIRRILYASDFTPGAEQALPEAHWLAREMGAELHLFHALIPPWEYLDPLAPYPVPQEESLPRLEASAEAEQERLVRSLGATTVPVRSVVRRSSTPATAILAYVAEADIDLIVAGTHGRRGLGRWVLGSVAEELVRLAPCPVLTVREQEKPRPAEVPKRILLPIDFSEPSRAVLPWARELAARWGSELELLHIVEQLVLPTFYFPGAPSAQPLDLEKIRKTAVEELGKLIAAEGPAVRSKIEVVQAPPALGILEIAKDHQIDLIVMATRGLTGLEHLLLGSTAEKVVRQAPCPVLTVGSKALEAKG